MEPKKTATEKMTTLSEETNKAVKKGYVENFSFASTGLTIGDHKKSYTPEEVKIANFYRFEGYSDPQDNAILYLIETSDGKKGTLVDAYGVDADAKLSTFLHAVEDIQKK